MGDILPAGGSDETGIPARLNVLREIFRIPLPFTGIELPIYGYGMMVLIGFLAATWVFQRGARRYGWDPARISDLSMWMVLIGLAGGRTFYYIQFFGQDFRGQGWLAIFKIWEGGLVLYGGVLAGFAVIVFFAYRSKKPLLPLLDALAPAVAVGIGFGRIGCLLNGCCWGKLCAVDYPLGISFPEGSPPAIALAGSEALAGASPLVHPAQIYASVNAFLLAAVLWFLHRARPPRGVTAGAFLLGYGASRFLLESIRGDHRPAPGAWTVSQTISSFVLISGILVIVWSVRRSSVRRPAGSSGAATKRFPDGS